MSILSDEIESLGDSLSLLVTDPNRKDNPITFANKTFCELTGYSRAEVLGRNCRFLQGPETDEASRTELREAIETRQEIEVDILNYRKNGTTFLNRLRIRPVTDNTGRLLYFLGIQNPIVDDEVCVPGIATSGHGPNASNETTKILSGG